MILLLKGDIIDIFTGVVRRVAVNKRILPVIVTDQNRKILIFNHHPVHSLCKVLYDAKQAPNGKRHTCKTFTPAAVAVAKQFEVSRCPFQVIVSCSFRQKQPSFFLGDIRKKNLRQPSFLVCKGAFGFFFLQELSQLMKIFPRVQRQKAKLPDERQRAIPHAAVQIHKISVKIIKDLKAVRPFFSKQHRTGAAKRLNVPLVFRRKERVQNF